MKSVWEREKQKVYFFSNNQVFTPAAYTIFNAIFVFGCFRSVSLFVHFRSVWSNPFRNVLLCINHWFGLVWFKKNVIKMIKKKKNKPIHTLFLDYPNDGQVHHVCRQYGPVLPTVASLEPVVHPFFPILHRKKNKRNENLLINLIIVA